MGNSVFHISYTGLVVNLYSWFVHLEFWGKGDLAICFLEIGCF